MRFYKYVQSHIITFDHHVSVIPVTIIKVPYKCTLSILFIVQKCMIKPLGVTHVFDTDLCGHKIAYYVIIKVHRNILLKSSNMWLNIFVEVLLLVYHVNIKIP
jgi:hypothetical protein